jgi:hypothetical protein
MLLQKPCCGHAEGSRCNAIKRFANGQTPSSHYELRHDARQQPSARQPQPHRTATVDVGFVDLPPAEEVAEVAQGPIELIRDTVELIQAPSHGVAVSIGQMPDQFQHRPRAFARYDDPDIYEFLDDDDPAVAPIDPVDEPPDFL